VEALSGMGSKGKPSELCVRTKPSSREEVASGSSSGCKECDECEECEESEEWEGDRNPRPKWKPGRGIGARGRDGNQGECLLGLPLCLGMLTARERWLGYEECPRWMERDREEPIAGERQGSDGKGLKHSKRAPRERKAGISHICAVGGDEG
jgi:hypothetical protein